MPAVIQVVDGRTVIQVGENTAATARDAVTATTAAGEAVTAKELAELAALTLPTVFETTADGVAAVGEGETFWAENADGPALYRKVSGAASELDVILSRARLNSPIGASEVGKADGGTVEDHIVYVIDPLDRIGGGSRKSTLGGIHVFPATTPGGDDGPNVVLGSASGTDLPASTFGNLVSTPRDNDVSGSEGYRNRLGSATTLAVILGGDNDINALAAFNIGHHNRADTTGGGAPSHPMMIGTYINATEAYTVGIGTNHNVHAIKAAAVGGDSTRIGTEGSGGTAGRNSFAGAGFQCTIDGAYAATLGGQFAKATRDYSIASGHGGDARTIGEQAHSSGPLSTVGDAQVSRYHLSRTVTGATAAELLAGGAARAAIGSKMSVSVQGQVKAVRSDVEGEEASWNVEFTVSNMSGVLTLLESTITPRFESVATGGGRNAWVCDVVVTVGRWAVRVAGEGAPLTTLLCTAELTESMERKL